MEEDNNKLTKEDLTKNRCIKYVDINEEFFKTISKKYLLVYEYKYDIIKNLLDNFVDKTLKLYNLEPFDLYDVLNKIKSNISIFVKSNIDIFNLDLDFYFKQKTEELIQNMPNFNITTIITFIQEVIKNNIVKYKLNIL